MKEEKSVLELKDESSFFFMNKSDSPTFSVYVPFYCLMADSRNKIIIEFSFNKLTSTWI